MAEQFEHGYAIIIGVDDNEIKRLALPDVAKDVKALHDVIVHPERCGYKAENVKMLSGAESTKENIFDALYWLQDKVKEDGDATAVIYYSGHGMVDKGQYYLIPYNIGELRRVRQSAIKAEDLTAEIAAIQSKRMLVMLDCCHAGGMDIKSVDAEPVINSAAFPLDLPDTKDIPTFASGSKDVSLLADGEGRAILNSSTGAQSSYMRKDGKMSLFTYHLIEAPTGHAPHEDGDKTVLVTDVMSYVTRHVEQTAQAEGRAQTPVMRTTGVFPIAQLIGGEGLAKGMGAIPPDPLEPLPEAGTTVNFNQQGQTVSGTQINTGGDAHIGQIGDTINTGGGSYVTGVNTGGGDFTMGNKTVNQGDVVHGDKFTGDKVMGDKIDGDKISIGNISGSSGIAIGRGATSTVDHSTHTTTTSGDTFNMSGNFQGANVNIKSTLENVTQSISTLPYADASAKAELVRLVAQLDVLLKRVPTAEGAKLSTETEALLQMAANDKPNPTIIEMLGAGLKQTASAFKNNLPEIVDVAAKIVTAVMTASHMGN